MKGISLYSIVPVRVDAREGAEQETQMLFGETCEIIDRLPSEPDEQPQWYQVRLDADGEEGYVDAKMVTAMSDEEYTAYSSAPKETMVAFPMAYAMSENNGQTIPLTAGTRLANYQNGRFEVLGVGFRIDPSMVITAPRTLNQENLLQTVRFFLNVPYLWGGKNALGMDCSGFVQVIMSLFGITLPRNASQQAKEGTAVSSLIEGQAGDLVFFTKPHQAVPEEDIHITHVGILIDSERVIHCSGRVKVEKIDSTGIFNPEIGDYSHRLVAVRKVKCEK